ncbi:MAG: UDP-3-O-(3-hydroxymyristoyl)glucosamine N-acyltransferase [Armatimonadetes bacterium]|nr:UDP-3-O-(3-hydroxymyristoyl)glucosamine N-acyltransferase [Armatimonadota bacterium]
MIRKSVGELAGMVGGEVVGDPSVVIAGAADIEDACAGDIVFADSPKNLDDALASAAAAVIAHPDAKSASKPLIRAANPKLSFARAISALTPEPERPVGIDSTSRVGTGLKAGRDVSIGFNAFVGDDVTLGDGVWIHPYAYIGSNVSVGNGSVIRPMVAVLDNVTIGVGVTIHAGSVIGADGFGYIAVGGEHIKIPQVGSVVIGDNVEIGANCTIDRARTGKTEIGSGTKIDNMVHIAHNVTIGRNCIIVAQTGISGSVEIGDRVMFGGQCGVADHVTIGDGAMMCARTGVIGDVPAGAFVYGFPARPHKDEMRVQAATRKLPELLKTVRHLEKRIRALEESPE